jgi:hypothetical protein
MENLNNPSISKKPFMFTKEEKAILKPYVTGEKEINKQVCDELSVQIGRSFKNIYQYIYRNKRAVGKSKKVKANSVKVKADKTVTRDKSLANNTPMFKQGEFIIPVSSWEVRNNNGTTSLVLKFDKSI